MTPAEFRALVKRVGLKKRRAPLPRAARPDRQADRYAAELLKLLKPLRKAMTAALLPIIKDATANASKLATDAKKKSAGQVIDDLVRQWEKANSREKTAKLAELTANSVSDFQVNQLERQLSAAFKDQISVNVFGEEPWLDAAIGEFTSENVSLIRSVPRKTAQEIETLIAQEVADGTRWETIAGKISQRFDVGESRAKLIARDQVGKFYGDLNRTRQSDLGITRFIWRTMRDNRVREEHAGYDGNSYEWSDPPEGGPGEPVNCRCYADPDIESALE